MIKKKFYIIGYIMVYLASCVSPKSNYIKYYQNVNEANYYFYNRNYDSAILYFENAFSNVPKIADVHRYSYIVSLNNSEREEEALKLLDQKPIGFEQNDSIYFRNLNNEARNLLEKKAILMDSMRHDSITNSSSFKTMMVIYNRDQKYRKMFSLSKKTNDTIYQNKCLDSLIMSDSINMLEILKMIKEVGLNAGVNNPYSAYWSTIFVHLPYDFLYNNQEMFQNEMLNGNLLPNHFYIGVDRVYYDVCSSKSLYLQYAKNSIIENQSISFEKLAERGLSPYFYSTNMNYTGGAKPPKNPFYTYYREHKQEFNCSKYNINLNIPKQIICE